jgi:hypothetical protein
MGTHPTFFGVGDAYPVPRSPWQWEGGTRMWLDETRESRGGNCLPLKRRSKR